MSLYIQFLTLSLMAGSGVVLGAAFDTIEVITNRFKLRYLITILMDIGYWLAATIFVFRVLVYANDGQVRLFIFLGLLIGALLYFYIFSHIVKVAVTWVLNVFIRIVKGMIRIVHILVVKPLLYVYRMLRIVVGFLRAISIFLGRNVLQWVKYVFNLIRRWF